MPARKDVTLVARAAMGATYCVWAATNASPLGLLRQVVAMRGGAAAPSDGPARDLLAATRRTLIAGRSGVPSVGADQSARLREVGERELRGVLPLLDRMPADEAEQVRTWLVDVAIGVAGAGPDRSTDEPINAAEAGAIERVGEILMGRVGPVEDAAGGGVTGGR
ncbi:hypothetical protein [Nakamurella sp.]|uniref:hypothetical protein n=1 Tax=Nakamurella sp. TaxID=1869182 RepID=UPI003B3A949C